MATTIYRLIKYGLQTFWRQRLLTAATMVVILLALLVFQGLIIFGVIGNAALHTIQDKIDISIYFKTNTPEDEILRVKREVEERAEIKEVVYTSRDRAEELFRERHKDDPDYIAAIDLVGENPLLAHLDVKANNSEDYAVVAGYIESIVSADLVEKITYNENQAVIDRLNSIIRVSRRVGILSAIFLTAVAVLVSFNTILLGIYSNRDEIGIMRLVGASNFYVRGPFIVLGIIYGVIASVLSMAIIAPVVFLSSNQVQDFIQEMDLAGYFTDHLFVLFLYQLAFGVGIGILSSFIAIRRYLKT